LNLVSPVCLYKSGRRVSLPMQYLLSAYVKFIFFGMIKQKTYQIITISTNEIAQNLRGTFSKLDLTFFNVENIFCFNSRNISISSSVIITR
jgi:hypothetical protein